MFVFFHRYVVSFILIILFHFTNAFITRLPCKFHGNFSIHHDNTRYSGTVVQTVEAISKVDCVTLCVVTSSCAYINHNMITSQCELMEIDSGNKQTEVGWVFWTTVYGAPMVSLHNLSSCFILLRNCF